MPPKIDQEKDFVIYSDSQNSQSNDELENANFDQLTSIGLRAITTDTRQLKISSGLYTQSGPSGPYSQNQIWELIGPAPRRYNGFNIEIDKNDMSAFALNMTLKIYVVAGSQALEWKLTCCRKEGSDDCIATIESIGSDDKGVIVRLAPIEKKVIMKGYKIVTSFRVELEQSTYDYGIPFYTLESVTNSQKVFVGVFRGQLGN